MAKLPENKERRLQGLNQDVLAVRAPVEPVVNEPVPLRKSSRKQQAVATSESSRSGTVWLALGIAIVALLLAVWQWISNQQLSSELGKLKADYYQLASTVSQTADRAPEPIREPAAAGPGDSSAVVNLRDDLRELSARVRALSVSVAKVSQDEGEAAKLEKRIAELESSLRAVSGRVTTLANRPAPTAAPAPTPVAATAAPDPRVDALQTKVTKIDKDLQALYRILQGG